MRLSRTGRVTGAALGVAGLVLAAGCGGGDDPRGRDQTLVVETSFNLQTIDPHRQFDFTGKLFASQIYQTALRFEGDDVSEPVDGLCSYEISDDQKVVTLTLADTGATFADGSEVTVDDIVFSYQRLQGIESNSSFFLEDIEVEKVDEQTLTLTSEQANPTLPYILPNISLAIVNADVVRDNGGSTDPEDEAGPFLDKESQGSGPYQVESYDASSEVVLTVNPEYSGEEPAYKRVVVRNVDGPTQKIDVEAGEAQFALDLNPDQVADLDQNAVTVESIPSWYSVYAFANMDPEVNEFTADPKFREALRYALDFDSLVALGGEGAQPLASLVPNGLIGATDPGQVPDRDLEKAEKLLSEAGYSGEPIPFHYSADHAVSGVEEELLAQKMQSQLGEAGITLDLKPAPPTTALDGYRSGKQPFGLGSWGADYPDPESYMVFPPGGSVAERVRWAAGDTPEIDELKKAALAAGTPEERDAAYAELYSTMAESGPFLTLLQPIRSVVASKEITEFVSKPDVALFFETVR